MTRKLREQYLEFLTDLINNFSPSDIDGFTDDLELEEDEIGELLSLDLQVTVMGGDNQ